MHHMAAGSSADRTSASSLVADEFLNVQHLDGTSSDKDVWAIGDAAKSEGAVLPATAQGKFSLEHCALILIRR